MKWIAGRNWIGFILFTLLVLWSVHALVFFAHEFGHSVTAWLMDWKDNPLALNYGHLTIGNLLMQGQIDENVDYDPMFAHGADVQAGIIAAAGMVIGNALITYPLSLWGFKAARRRGSRGWALAFFYMCTASVGNFIDYVPVRTFSSHGDMHTVAIGFHCSPWWIIVVLGIPFGVAVVHFLGWFVPRALVWIFPKSRRRRMITAFLTVFALFGFYGAAGWSGYGSESHLISVISVCAGTPVALLLVLWHTEWRTDRTTCI